MQYSAKTNWNDIKQKYDFVVAWGTGSLFNMNYQEDYFPIDMLVDGTMKNIGIEIGRFKVCGPDDIKKKMTGNVLIVIYTIYEIEILNQIEELDISTDTIIYNLLEIETPGAGRCPMWNGKHADDMVLLELIRRLGIDKLEYLDIGVCHPIMRNNTYTFYERGWRGVLVEPNPVFHPLIKKYRENDSLLPCGAGLSNSELDYYAFADRLGYGTFDKALGESRRESGLNCNIKKISIVEINEIIENNFEKYPTIIDIDIEGMDYELIMNLDTEKYPVEIIMCETLLDEEKYSLMMNGKGYLKYASVGENTIFYRGDLSISGLYGKKVN